MITAWGQFFAVAGGAPAGLLFFILWFRIHPSASWFPEGNAVSLENLEHVWNDETQV
jgi:hypothetical protein